MSSTINPFANSLRPSTGVNCARYVGRVGALAVSLGVGFAIATNPGVAYADESTDSDPQPNTMTTTNETTTTNTASAAQSNNTAAATRQAKRPERNRILRVFGVNPSNVSRQARNERPRIGRDDQTNGDVNADTATSGDDATSADNEVIVGEVKEAEGSASTRLRTTASKKPAEDIVRRLVSPRRAQSSAPTTRIHVNTHIDKTTALKAPVQPSITATTANAVNQSPAAGSAGRVANQTLAAVAPVTPTNPTPVARPAALVSGFLAAVGLAPSLTSPTTPPRAPAAFVWAVLGFVRREIEQVQRTYLNRTPDARDDIVPAAGRPPITEDAPFTFDPRVNDRDEDALEIAAVSNGAYGTVTTNGTSVTYTPNTEAQKLKAGQTVTDTFTYTVSDGGSAPHLHGIFGLFSRGHSDTATVTVTLTGVNDVPTVVGDTKSVAEEQVLSDRLRPGSDVDGDPLTYEVKDGPTHGALTTFDRATGAYTYKPNANYSGADSFTFVANDGTTDSAKGTVAITVTPVNDNPEAVMDTLAILESAGATTVDVLANDTDVDGGALTITGVTPGPTPLGTVSYNSGSVTYTPNAVALALAPGQVETDSFTYTVSDGNGGTATGTVNVTVTGVSDNAVLSTGTYTPAEVVLAPDGDFGLIRNADGTLTRVDYDAERGWVVGANLDTDIDVGAFDLDGRLAYAYTDLDGSLRLLDRDTGREIDRARDIRTGATYRFDDVTDVAVDRRVEANVQVDTAYVIERDGTLSEIDTRTGTVVRSVETSDESSETFRVAAASAVSPKLAVAPGSRTVYVASGNRIAVVKRQTVALRSAGDIAAAAESDQLVYDSRLDRSLDGEVTALEVSKDGKRLYATVASVDASGQAVSRLVAIDVSEVDGALSPVRDSVALRSGARSLGINDDLNRAYVVGERDVSVVGLGDLDVIRRVDTGASAGGVAVSPRRDTILVTNPDAHAVSIVTDAPITIELDWGSTPRDLDGHLFGPAYHVSYVDPTHEVTTEGGTQEIGAFLNVDDQDGDGPEIIQIDTRTTGVYNYYVVNFSGETDFGSDTTVSVRDPRSGITQTYSLPSGSGRYWTVFKLTVSADGTATLESVNTLSDENPDERIPTPPGSATTL